MQPAGQAVAREKGGEEETGPWVVAIGVAITGEQLGDPTREIDWTWRETPSKP